MFYKESKDRERERGFMSERSIETAFCVAAAAPTLRNQANKHSPGTSRSDTIGPFPHNGESDLRMSYQQKKQLYAKDARPLLGVLAL